MSMWQQKNKILVTCPKGASPYLKAEIEALGFPVHEERAAAVQTQGTLEDTMFLNLHVRTAQRVLYLVKTMPADTPGSLYSRIAHLSWENIIADIGKGGYLCVTSTVDNPLINDTRFVNMKVKDAIVDRIREKCGMRPDSGPEKHKSVIHVYWKHDRADMYLDTSGERLAMRGYRKIPLTAPMQETLAAAVILASGWKSEGACINPMCGSGTLAIEAALIALNRAPGLLRRNFGFMHIAGFPTLLWQEMRSKARNAADRKKPLKIIATDINPRAIAAAKQNAQTAGVDHLIEFAVCSFEKTPVPDDGKGGVIILNPPYGERMGEIKKLETTYKEIGDFFKKVGGGYRGYIFTGNIDLMKKVGLRTSHRIIFFNSEIECRLLEYELYSGSRKKDKGVTVTPSAT